jgi:hypothetical protein
MFDDVRKLALTLDHVEESTSYGTPAFKVRGKLVARLREDGETLVVGMDFDQRAELLAADPETYYITDHYVDYPWILVRLPRVHPDALRDLLHGAASLASRAAPRKVLSTRRRPPDANRA